MNNKIGRPPLSPTERSVTKTFTLTPSQLEFLKAHGFGNASLGIRRLVDEKMKGDAACWVKG